MPTREVVKQLIFNFNKEQKAEWLKRAQEIAHSLALRQGEVCADDIHALCPLPDDVDPRIMGSVFKGMAFVRFKKSDREVCHHRIIGVFRMPGGQQ